MFECDIAHRRSVAILCMMYKIRCNPRHTLYGVLPEPYTVPCSANRRCALVAHLYTYAPPSCRTSQNRMTFVSLSVSLCNDLGDHVFDGVVLAGFKSYAITILLA